MKATKKIVGAACALVAAVGLAAGSTYAWFSSNGTVTATGLNVDVSTSSSYLIIADSVANLSQNANTMSLAHEGAVLLPSAYYTTIATATPEEYGKSTNWYTGQGNGADDYELNEETQKPLTGEDPDDALYMDKYVLQDEIYISISEGSTAVTDVTMTMSANPTWSKTNSAETNNDAVSLVILYKKVGDTDFTKIDINSANNHGLGGDGINELSLGGIADSTKYIELHVYTYFDGNNESVYTKNSANLTGTTISFTFKDKSNGSVAPSNPVTPPAVTEP